MSIFKRRRNKKRTRRRTALQYLAISALLLLLLNVVYSRGQLLPIQAARLTEQQLGAWEKPTVLKSCWAEDELARLYLSANGRAVFFSYAFPDWTGWSGTGMVLDCTQEARAHLADGTLYAAEKRSLSETVDVLHRYPYEEKLVRYVFGRVDDPAVHELHLLAHDGTVCQSIGADELIERDGYRYFLVSCEENAPMGHAIALYDASGVLLEQISGEQA